MFGNKYDHLINKYHHRFLHEKTKDINVTRADAPYLYRMLKLKKVKMNDLINKIPFHKSHATRSINKLVEDGYILKQIDPDDRRGYILTLTEQGEAVGRRVDEIFAEWEELVSSVITEEEAIFLEKISKKIYDNLKDHYKEDMLDGENI